jgi:hypothetical protein
LQNAAYILLDVNYRRLIVIVFGAVGFTSFFSSFVFYQHLMHVSPTAPDALSRQLYQLNEHGYLFYVTREQHRLFYTLLLGGSGLVALAVILNYQWKVVKNLTPRGWRYPT